MTQQKDHTLSAMTSAELVSRVRSNREAIADLTSMNFEMLEELRARVGEAGGVIIADDLVAIVEPQKQIQSLNSFAIRNEFSHDEMVEKKFIQFVNRRQAVRISESHKKSGGRINAN